MALTKNEVYAIGLLRNAAAELESQARALNSDYGKSIKNITVVRDAAKDTIDVLREKLAAALNALVNDIHDSPDCDCKGCKETISAAWLAYRRWPEKSEN